MRKWDRGGTWGVVRIVQFEDRKGYKKIRVCLDAEIGADRDSRMDGPINVHARPISLSFRQDD